MQQPVYLTVSALNKYIKTKLENDVHLKKVLLKGEISNFKAHSSGHFYLSLKDERTQISAMMFANYAKVLSFVPKDGDKVLVEGYISVYEVRATYNITLTKMTIDGIGELFLKYEKLKKDFEALGYFDQSIKKPIPRFPKAIGVITSPTGAVIQDIKTTVSRRYLLTRIYLYPALVQGEGSKESLVKQIKRANDESKVDVIILGRGGGSLEDLWSFNEPEVIGAIYESKIPIITAIGHETDTTLSDYAGDLRAPTPTAAAELATPRSEDIITFLKEKQVQLTYYLNEKVKQMQQSIMHLDERLSLASPMHKMSLIEERYDALVSGLHKNYRIYLNNCTYQVNLLRQSLLAPSEKLGRMLDKQQVLQERLKQSYQHYLKILISNFQGKVDKLEALNPLAYMQKGFALTTKDKQIITSIGQVNKDDLMDVEFTDGIVKTKVLEKREK